jgi:predicted DNA binding CopG/RHH family protein
MSRFGDADPLVDQHRKQITVHFSEAELEIIQTAANREMIPRNTYIRNKVLQVARAALGLPP